MDNSKLLLNNTYYNEVANLNSINMFHGQLYETIVTTVNTLFEKNAAPIGVVCKDEKHIVIYLDQSNHTAKNIVENGEFMVNITTNPLLFTYSTIGDLDDEYFTEFNDFPLLKNTLGFFKAHVIKDTKHTKEDNIGKQNIHIITAEVESIFVSECDGIKPINRAMSCVIESLIHYSRFESSSTDKRNEYWIRILELNRVAQKVGGNDEKKSMKIILNKIEETYCFKK